MSTPETCTRCGGTGHLPAACPWVKNLQPEPKRGLLAILKGLFK